MTADFETTAQPLVIRDKAEIMVDHFMAQVIGKRKIGGKARAMIVCNGIARAVDYYREVTAYSTDGASPTIACPREAA